MFNSDLSAANTYEKTIWQGRTKVNPAGDLHFPQNFARSLRKVAQLSSNATPIQGSPKDCLCYDEEWLNTIAKPASCGPGTVAEAVWFCLEARFVAYK